jgi:hypothetical protein
MGDIAKLPKWAQEEIQLLKSNLATAKIRAASAFGETETRVEIDRYRRPAIGGEPRCFLPDRTSICFAVDGGKIDVTMHDGRLRIWGTNFSGHFNVRSDSSNVLTVGFEPRAERVEP